jgi:hypothetical protein
MKQKLPLNHIVYNRLLLLLKYPLGMTTQISREVTNILELHHSRSQVRLRKEEGEE